MDLQAKLTKRLNELFEKYELESVPKSSWKDLCLLEIKRYAVPPEIKPDKPNPEGRM